MPYSWCWARMIRHQELFWGNKNNLQDLLEETKVLSEKVARVHGDHHEELVKIYDLVKDSSLDIKNLWEIFEEIRKLSLNYSIPDGACKSYQALYTNLKKLDTIINKK